MHRLTYRRPCGDQLNVFDAGWQRRGGIRPAQRGSELAAGTLSVPSTTSVICTQKAKSVGGARGASR